MTKKTAPPSKSADQFVARLLDGMRGRIAESAKRNGRSMNAEINHALHDYYMRQDLSDQHVDEAAGEHREQSTPTSELSYSAPQLLQIDNLADIIVARLAERLEVQKVQITQSGKMLVTVDPTFGKTTKEKADAAVKVLRKGTHSSPLNPKPEQVIVTTASGRRINRTRTPSKTSK